MAYKNEKGVLTFNIDSEQKGKLQIVARNYCPSDDIAAKTMDNGRTVYRITIKHKNMNRLRHDVEILKICGIDVRGGAQCSFFFFFRTSYTSYNEEV